MDLDKLNIGLIFVSCVIAHFIPFELLLFSYAFLGPAHYLTEISWLHDKGYFLAESDKKWHILPLIILSACLLIFEEHYFAIIIFTFSLAVCLVLFKKWQYRVVFSICLGIFLYSLTYFFNLGVIWALLPTLIHVFLFTALFMWYGASRSESKLGKVSVGFLMLAALTFFLPVSTDTILDNYVEKNIVHLDNIFNYVVETFNFQLNETIAKMAGFVAFAYTYHYLNWFSKTGIIQWHKITAKRALVLFSLYIFSIGLYMYDYAVGFAVLLGLSLAHVVLEFPLNARTIGGLFFLGRKKAKS